MHTEDDHFGPRDKPSEASVEAGYETSDAPTSPVVIGLVILVALMLLGFVGGKIFEEIFTATEVKTRASAGPLTVREEVKGPKLQARPEIENDDYVRTERQKLSSYGWVDRSAGVVRIPIERAMELVVQQGLPKWEPVEAKIAEPAEPAVAADEVTEPDSGAAAPTSDGDSAGAESPVGTPSDEEFTGSETPAE